MSVKITLLKFDELPKNEKYMLTNGANEILSSEGGGSNKGIRHLDIGVFAHYDNKTKETGPLNNITVDASNFTVLLDSQNTSASFEDSMKAIMVPIISKVGKVPENDYVSPDGQAITPKNLVIGSKPTYFAGSVIKAMSKDKTFKGVYHIKAINYRHIPEPPTYPNIENDAVVQGYRLFVDYYVAIIRDFIYNYDANTLYLAQCPGETFGGHALQFYTFLLNTIYLVLKLNNIPEGKKILFNLEMDDIPINNESYLWNLDNFDTIYPIHFTDPVKKIESTPVFNRRFQLKNSDLGAGGETITQDRVSYDGYFYKKILPYILTEVSGIFGPIDPKSPLTPDPNDPNKPPDPNNPPNPNELFPKIKGPLQGFMAANAMGQTSVLATPIDSLEELYVTFYNTMETWINDDTLEKMFSGRQIITTDMWVSELYGKSDNKIKMIFDYLRNLNKPFTMGGGATLEDFKNYIREQIRNIKISQ